MEPELIGNTNISFLGLTVYHSSVRYYHQGKQSGSIFLPLPRIKLFQSKLL